MEVLKFTIRSKISFFRKNDTRGSSFDVTFSHIHKNAIRGIVGAVIGLEGYNTHSLKKKLKLTEDKFPEFYTKLKDLEVSIVPVTETGDFKKFIHFYSEKNGHFGDKGNNLLVREQQILNGQWEIYLKLDNLDPIISTKIKDYFLNGKCVYIPYMGKNDNFANITDVQLVTIEKQFDVSKIDSLFYTPEEGVQITFADYHLREFLPVELDEKFGRYVLKEITYTDEEIELEHYSTVNNRKICFI